MPCDFWYCSLPKGLVEAGKTQEFFDIDKFKAGIRTHNLRVHLFFGIEMSFFVVSRWPKSPFGIEISFLVSRHLDRLLPGINPCVLFGPRHPVNWRSKNLDSEKKIEIYVSSDYLGSTRNARIARIARIAKLTSETQLLQ